MIEDKNIIFADFGQNETIPISRRFGNYEIVRLIALGGFSVVYLVKQVFNNQLYACKICLRQQLIDYNIFWRFETELRRLQQFCHPNIVQLFDVIYEQQFIYLILEYCENGELFEKISRDGRYREDQAKALFQQILNGLKYIHSRNVVHRDLKPENILLDKNGVAKIADFGLCHSLNGILHTPCGSTLYASPEVLSGNGYNGERSDIWSLGVILFAMVTGTLPWREGSEMSLVRQIHNGQIEIPIFLSTHLTDLLQRMMEVDPEKRITLDEILKHNWFTQLPIYFTKITTTQSELYPQNVLSKKKKKIPISSSKKIVRSSSTSSDFSPF